MQGFDMNPLAFLSLARANWQLIVFGVLIAGNVLFYNLWQHSKGELIAYSSGVEALGNDALKEKARIEDEHQSNLETVKHDYESTLPAIRAGAVAAYLAAHRVQSNAGQGSMRGITGSLPAHDGAGQKQLSAPICQSDEQFIQDAADDAQKLSEWQEWSRLNRIPVR